jgi:O-antigen ligase
VCGGAAGILAGSQPLLLGIAILGVALVATFIAAFEVIVLGLLVVRSALDIFAAWQLPTLVALAIDSLTALYIAACFLFGKKIKTDRFWWFFFSWVLLQGVWPILAFLGGLGFSGWSVQTNIREWMRLFSLPMLYLLVMQLKGKLAPQKVITWLLFSLIAPVTAALMQELLPPSMLPPLLSLGEGWATQGRAFGTFGHANTFATYLLLFLGVSLWKLMQAKNRLPWIALLLVLCFAYVGTHALVSLAMLAVLIMFVAAPRLSAQNLIGSVVLLALVFGLFASTDFGRERLTMISETPIFNSNIDVSRAILLSQSDYNSFNWRLAHWTHLLNQWKNYPILGYGLGTAAYLSPGPLMYPPHNDFLRALVEGGVVGLVGFIVLLLGEGTRIVQLLQGTRENSSKKDLCWVMLGVFAATTVAMFTDNVWMCTAFHFYWLTILAVVGWEWELEADSDAK